MKLMDIEALFNGASASETAPRKKPGRKGRRFIFNKDRYDQLKQNNDFKLEF